MTLLTQEQGAQLKVGDKVNVCWFTPRKSKDNVPSREWNGRTEYYDYAWHNQEVASEPYLSCSDGYVVQLKNRTGIYDVARLEKV